MALDISTYITFLDYKNNPFDKVGYTNFFTTTQKTVRENGAGYVRSFRASSGKSFNTLFDYYLTSSFGTNSIRFANDNVASARFFYFSSRNYLETYVELSRSNYANEPLINHTERGYSITKNEWNDFVVTQQYLTFQNGELIRGDEMVFGGGIRKYIITSTTINTVFICDYEGGYWNGGEFECIGEVLKTAPITTVTRLNFIKSEYSRGTIFEPTTTVATNRIFSLGKTATSTTTTKSRTVQSYRYVYTISDITEKTSETVTTFILTDKRRIWDTPYNTIAVRNQPNHSLINVDFKLGANARNVKLSQLPKATITTLSAKGIYYFNSVIFRRFCEDAKTSAFETKIPYKVIDGACNGGNFNANAFESTIFYTRTACLSILANRAQPLEFIYNNLVLEKNPSTITFRICPKVTTCQFKPCVTKNITVTNFRKNNYELYTWQKYPLGSITCRELSTFYNQDKISPNSLFQIPFVKIESPSESNLTVESSYINTQNLQEQVIRPGSTRFAPDFVVKNVLLTSFFTLGESRPIGASFAPFFGENDLQDKRNPNWNKLLIKDNDRTFLNSNFPFENARKIIFTEKRDPGPLFYGPGKKEIRLGSFAGGAYLDIATFPLDNGLDEPEAYRSETLHAVTDRFDIHQGYINSLNNIPGGLLTLNIPKHSLMFCLTNTNIASPNFKFGDKTFYSPNSISNNYYNIPDAPFQFVKYENGVEYWTPNRFKKILFFENSNEATKTPYDLDKAVTAEFGINNVTISSKINNTFTQISTYKLSIQNEQNNFCKVYDNFNDLLKLKERFKNFKVLDVYFFDKTVLTGPIKNYKIDFNMNTNSPFFTEERVLLNEFKNSIRIVSPTKKIEREYGTAYYFTERVSNVNTPYYISRT